MLPILLTRWVTHLIQSVIESCQVTLSQSDTQAKSPICVGSAAEGEASRSGVSSFMNCKRAWGRFTKNERGEQESEGAGGDHFGVGRHERGRDGS